MNAREKIEKRIEALKEQREAVIWSEALEAEVRGLEQALEMLDEENSDALQDRQEDRSEAMEDRQQGDGESRREQHVEVEGGGLGESKDGGGTRLEADFPEEAKVIHSKAMAVARERRIGFLTAVKMMERVLEKLKNR